MRGTRTLGAGVNAARTHPAKDGHDPHQGAVPAPAPSLLPVVELTRLHRCGEIAIPGSDIGRVAHHRYCDWLPQGHDGPHDHYPLPERLAAEWTRAFEKLLADDQPSTYRGRHR